MAFPQRLWLTLHMRAVCESTDIPGQPRWQPSSLAFVGAPRGAHSGARVWEFGAGGCGVGWQGDRVCEAVGLWGRRAGSTPTVPWALCSGQHEGLGVQQAWALLTVLLGAVVHPR